MALLLLVVVGAGLVARRLVRTSPSVTPTEPTSIAPLTGLPGPTGVVDRRGAVTVKIGNTAQARPQYGLEQADVVYEEVVEGGITRLAAVFQSQAPDRVGPVRSVRLTDQAIVWPIRGVFAYSGGNPLAVASIGTAPVTPVDESGAGAAMFRDPERQAPHNLYARVDELYRRGDDPPPSPLFAYRDPSAASAGDPVSSVRVGFQVGYDTTWSWDPASSLWRRSIFGAPDLDPSGDQLSTANVVVMSVRYLGGPGSDNAEAVLTGDGPVTVFSDGKATRGTWVRPDKARPALLVDGNQRPIQLTPGRTWVELPDVGYRVTTTP